MVKVKESSDEDVQRRRRESSVESDKGCKSRDFKEFVKENSVERSIKDKMCSGFDKQKEGIPEEEGMYTEDSDSDEVEKLQTNEEKTEKGKFIKEQQTKDNLLNFSRENEARGNTFPKLVSLHESNWKNRNFFILISFFVLLLALFCSSTLITNKTAENDNIKDLNKERLDKFFQTLKDIKKDFPSQEKEFWDKIFHGIKNVNRSNLVNKPAVILFLHNNSATVAECLAWKIGKAASQFLNTRGVIELPSESTINFSDNEIVTEYREPLKDKGVMIVYRLDEIPGIVARSFHTFCDTYNPLVGRSVLLFTLNERNLQEHEQLKPNKKAMELMKLLWKDTLIDAILNPLITRLTDNVLEVKSEEKSASCP